jgi:dihydroorotate dehydrogenase
MSTDVLRDMYQLTRGKIPLIGCGGIASGEDAYLKIRAGATLVQLYTAFAYEGPSMLPRIKVCLFLGKHQQCLLSTLRWSQVFLFF